MIELLDKTLYTIKEFLVFFILMCFIQASFYNVLGNNISEEDGGELTYSL
jgi:hypothetical protein